MLIVVCSAKMSIYAQIENYDFESWEEVFSHEQPEHWYCNGSSFDACVKVNTLESGWAVRMENDLPCVDEFDTNISKSRNNGSLTQYFAVSGQKFTLEYDLLIDSFEAPAAFRVLILNPGVGTVFSVSHSELLDSRFSHQIEMDELIDSLVILLEPRGMLKDEALHSCDLGYISAVIDNVKVYNTVGTEDHFQELYTVYPNPTAGLVFIDSKDIPMHKIEVFDVYGRIIKAIIPRSDGIVSLDLTGYSGIFFLRVMDSNHVPHVSQIRLLD